MRVLVAWADDSSVNLGVRALAQGSVDLLRQSFPTADFTFMNYGTRPEQIPWGSHRGMLRERLTGRRGMQEWLAGFDLLWDTRSGDSFTDIYGLDRHTTMTLVSEFAAQAGVPVVLAPQTIGPFGSRRARFMARRTLKRSRLVFARDPLSAAASARAGRPVDATTSDLVFGIDQPATPQQGRDVLLNVSGLLWQENQHVDAATYRSAVDGIIRGLLARGRSVSLFPHVIDSPDPDNDVPVALALAEEYAGDVDLAIPADLAEARAMIAGSRLVIGARMHACLNALSTGTPAIAMAYSRKFAPLMDAVGWTAVVDLKRSEEPAAEVLRHGDAPELVERALVAQATGQLLLSSLPSRVAAAL